MKQWRLGLYCILALIFTAICWLGGRYYFSRTHIMRANQPHEITMHVFVHGTFGSSLGLLSFFPVVNDDFKGTRYVKTTRGMRKDDFFFKDQPMLTRGLTLIKPSYDLAITEGKKYAAYPLIKAYADIQEYLDTNSEHLFYTFGWSGLLSRQRRRQESLRLYNALSQEVERLKKCGFSVKICVLAHSHGGNLVLNLAGINHAREGSEIYNSNDPTHVEERFLARQFFKSLPSATEAQQLSGHKKFDYSPETPPLHIDELYLLGTPIQPETDHYVTDKNTFGVVYNFYSEDDVIQRIDWVSTRRYYSDQRFHVVSKQDANIPHIIQAKIMLDKYHTINPHQNSWWNRLFSWCTTSTEPTPDPAHRDFWFATWKDDPREYTSWLAPVPLFILCPAITQCARPLGKKDIDINMIRMHDTIRLEVYNHNDRILLGTYDLPRSLVESFKEQLEPWRPPAKIKQKEFEVISHYVRLASEQVGGS